MTGESQLGQRSRHVPHGRAFRAQGQHGAQHLGDDVARLAHDDRVAHAHVLAVHLVLVVQRRARHGGAGHHHGIQLGHRGEHAGAAHLHGDVAQDGGLLFGRELERDGPARARGLCIPWPPAARTSSPSPPRRRSRRANLPAARAPGRRRHGPPLSVSQSSTSGFTWKPASRSHCRSSHWPDARSARSSATAYRNVERSRCAVTAGSFWRRLPAAALRGLANAARPLASAAPRSAWRS